MKKLAALLAVLVIVLACAGSVFASGLSITNISPKDGATGRQPSNMAIKVRFSENMNGGDELDAANKEKIKITDPEGNVLDFVIAHHDRYQNELWLVITSELQPVTSYTVTIQPGIVSPAGNMTSDSKTVTFTTRNVKTDGTISMVLMIVMFGAMFFFGQRETKKQMAATDVNFALAEAKKLNPYKIAKQKGISLEEAQAYCEKERAKAQKAVDKANAEKAKAEAARQAELEAAQARIEAELAAAHDASVYKVKGPRSVKAAGGTIPRSVRNRAKAREEAERAAEKQRAQNAKGKKSKK
ncbi:MAG: Ig-like domain-containing protein [Firmicutes bacterium]|nr:Ig-like domain-containing protein [Bacillota bacterium]